MNTLTYIPIMTHSYLNPNIDIKEYSRFSNSKFTNYFQLLIDS